MPRRFKEGGEYKFKAVPAGYDFLGPGNEVNYNVPRNWNDVVAKDHDIEYGEIIKEGGDPYVEWSDADQVFLDRLKEDDAASLAARGIFEGKKKAWQAGLINKRKSFYILQWDVRYDTTRGTITNYVITRQGLAKSNTFVYQKMTLM